MNLLTWILSLVVEWLRPLHRDDPVLAPVNAPMKASTGADGAGASGPSRAFGSPGSSGSSGSSEVAESSETPEAPEAPEASGSTEASEPVEATGATTEGSSSAIGRDLDRLFDEDLQRDLAGKIEDDSSEDDSSEDDFSRELAREREADHLAPAVGLVPMMGSGLSPANPFWRLGDALLRLVAPSDRAPLGASAWAAMVILPVALILLGEVGLEALGLAGDLLQLLLAVVALYFTVPLGRLWRRLDRLSLLAAAGDAGGFRQTSARWRADGFGPDGSGADGSGAAVDPDREALGSGQALNVGKADKVPGSDKVKDRDNDKALDRAGFSMPLIDGYRDVFAPMFWFTLIGAAGPVGYGLARLAAERQSGLPRRILYWIDWLPSRLAAASFALGGHFDEAMLSFRAALAAARYDRIDTRVDRESGFGQALIILPSAAGATGIRLAAPAIEARLRQASSDHEAPAIEPTIANFNQLRSLVGRTGMLWGGLWVLLALVG